MFGLCPWYLPLLGLLGNINKGENLSKIVKIKINKNLDLRLLVKMLLFALFYALFCSLVDFVSLYIILH